MIFDRFIREMNIFHPLEKSGKANASLLFGRLSAIIGADGGGDSLA